MVTRLGLFFLLCLFSQKLSAQTDSLEIKPRHLQEAMLDLDSMNRIPFLYSWDYQMKGEGFGKPGQNALPFVVKQAYRQFRFLAIPEPFKMNGYPRYPPNLPDGEWGIFAENGNEVGAQFQVMDNHLHGNYMAQFNGAVLRFFFIPYFTDTTLINDTETYSIQGQYEQGNKSGKWSLKSNRGKTLLQWKYDTAGKFQSEDPVLEKKYVPGLIRYQYVARDHQKIIQGHAKEIYLTYKVTKGGKLLKTGPYLRYYPDETLAEKGNFESGLKNGTWFYWDKYGELIRMEKWKAGKLVKSIEN